MVNGELVMQLSSVLIASVVYISGLSFLFIRQVEVLQPILHYIRQWLNKFVESKT